MKAGIVTDNYKLKIFRTNLKFAGFTWTESKGPLKRSTIMKVEFKAEDQDVLTAVVKTSNAQAVWKGKK